MYDSAQFTTWGGQRVTPWMAYQLTVLDRDLQAAFGVNLICNSAIRLPQEQIDIFLDRYVTVGNVNGRYVYDTRWWRGQLWYRVSDEGTVATPGTSNHEIQGDKAAVDIQDTGADAGVATRYSERGQWLRSHAAMYDLIASGDGFGEGWHFDIVDIWNTPPNTPDPVPVPEPEEGTAMRTISGPNGGQKFADEFGADDIASFFFVPNGVDNSPTWIDNIHAAWLLGGVPDGEQATDDGWVWELARHQADARWAAKRGLIVTDVVNALRPFFDALGQAVAGLDTKAIMDAIDKGLDSVVVKAQPIPDEVQEAIAQKTRELFKQDPLK